MPSLVLLRHGQSVWNKEDLFTGWTDVDLSEQGIQEALAAGRKMTAEGLDFDLCFTSVLKRAMKTLNLALEQMDRLWLPVEKNWRLNERHYGGLQGLNKAETSAKHGKDQVFIWRRSFDIPPPPLPEGDARLPDQDRRYADVPKSELPRTESLKDTVIRVLPYWNAAIAPALKQGKRVLIAAHGNSLRGLVKHLDQISDQDIPAFEIPTGTPLVYDLDENLKPKSRRFLAD